MRRKPFSVVLFDEIEKAHPDVFNTLLQILEDGRLTDAQGRTVDFKNTVLIMTSNLGTADLRKASLGFAKSSEAVTYERMKAKVNDALKAPLPAGVPEPDRRGHRLPRALPRRGHRDRRPHAVRGSREQLDGQGIGLELTPAAKELLAEQGYDPQLGARPLRRAIQQLIEDPLSEKILWKEFRVGETIVVDVETGEDGEPTLSFKAVEGFQAPPMELAGSGSSHRVARRPPRRPTSPGHQAPLARCPVSAVHGATRAWSRGRTTISSMSTWARPGGHEGDALGDVVGGERLHPLVDGAGRALASPSKRTSENSVCTMPGSISLTRTGWPSSSIRSVSVRARSAALAAW